MYDITIQHAASSTLYPNSKKLKQWTRAALKNKTPTAEVTLRIVDKHEITELNSTYRKKNKPTNVLSFPFEMPEGLGDEIPAILGDIVICADVVQEEAETQHKTLDAHWAHMVVHGILHLLGYDHENDQDAEVMESEEIHILKTLGFDDPYAIIDEGENNE